MSDRELMQQALEALNHVNVQDRVQIIIALRERLAQPEQKPFGYVTDSGKSAYFLKGVDLDDDTPLYTALPKREWVGLTDDEIKQTCYEAFSFDPYVIANAIEAKLKEKNT